MMKGLCWTKGRGIEKVNAFDKSGFPANDAPISKGRGLGNPSNRTVTHDVNGVENFHRKTSSSDNEWETGGGDGWGNNAGNDSQGGWGNGGDTGDTSGGGGTGGDTGGSGDGWGTGGDTGGSGDGWGTGRDTGGNNDGWGTGGETGGNNDGWGTGGETGGNGGECGTGGNTSGGWRNGGDYGGSGGRRDNENHLNNQRKGCGRYRGGRGARRGGLGGGGGSMTCYKCNEEGHMSRDCPQGGGGVPGGSMACYKCNEEGHMSRDCPQGGGRGGRGGSMTCYKCNEEGHMSRDCPQGGGGGSNNRACYKCGESTHLSRECPQGGGSDGQKCFKCNEEGHMSRECPNSDGRGGGGGGSGGGFECRRCQKGGHKASECTEKVKGPDGRLYENYTPKDVTDKAEELFAGTSVGINFSRYDQIPVKVSGADVPSAISSFEESGLRQLLLENVARCTYTKPTPVQKYALPIIMNGRDLMACAQTGSGKTAAFLLPIIHKIIKEGYDPNSHSKPSMPQAIVISPTRELALQIHTEAVKYSYGSCVKHAIIYGGTNARAQSEKLMRGCNILVATPGRLIDCLDRGIVSFSELKFLVLDEADKMLEQGFLDSIDKVLNHESMTPKGDRQTLLFSATFPESIQKMAHLYLENYLFLAVGIIGGASSDVEQIFHLVKTSEKRDMLRTVLLDQQNGQKCLIFCATKTKTDFLAADICQHLKPATSIHGDRFQSQREEALADFRMGKMDILVATAVASRGLDIKDVDFVINFDLPSGIDEYVHRIGRTGRLGHTGKAISFFDPEHNKELLGPLMHNLVAAQQVVPVWMEEMSSQEVYNSGGLGVSAGFGARDVRTRPGRNYCEENGEESW